MAKPDDDFRRIRAREEADLGPFFEAERAERVEISEAFLAAVLADAARERRPARPRLRGRADWAALLGRLGPLGGWPGAAALAGCAALGFWAGATGMGADLAAEALWTEAVSIDAAVDGVDGFFDLSAQEG